MHATIVQWLQLAWQIIIVAHSIHCRVIQSAQHLPTWQKHLAGRKLQVLFQIDLSMHHDKCMWYLRQQGLPI